MIGIWLLKKKKHLFKMNNDLKFYGQYRGVVADNSGKLGKVKIFVYGVYPEIFMSMPIDLPWAEPAQGLFGGNFTGDGLNTETGISGWPKVGAHVWVFFECGDFNKPIYFAACQAGDGWLSEHKDQWVIKTSASPSR